MIKILIGYIPGLALLLFFSGPLLAQTSDDAYQRPLTEVLQELQAQYQVQIRYSEKDIGDFMLKYADWRLRRGDLEQSLQNVLAPFDYIYVKQGEDVFKVTPYRYHLITPEEGAASLQYLLTQYQDRESWEARKAELKKCMREALQIDPLLEFTPSKPIVTNKRRYKGYTVENVAIETLPGLYVTGSVYKPTGNRGSMPVILCPNGHFGDGRYRAAQQYRCAALARMGAVTFSYDLFAWGESLLQVESKAHRKSIAHTIQTLNAIRVLDYMLSLKGTDPERVGITGGSGGGSQTMLITAIDDRIAVSVPVVMTSSYHSGGCPCESGMPVHLCGGRTNNAEMAAMAAPRPMLILSDGQDWTAHVPEIEFPYIQKIYQFYDAKDQVKNVHFPDEGHDYGPSKREAMYAFMAAHLGLDIKAVQDKRGNLDESECVIEDKSQLYVFGNDPESLPVGAIRNLDQLYRVLEQVRGNTNK